MRGIMSFRRYMPKGRSVMERPLWGSLKTETRVEFRTWQILVTRRQTAVILCVLQDLSTQ